jgi:predicted AAA+ superfamily ATPase
MDLLSRLIEKQLKQYLFKQKALVIIGARQVGKTTMLKAFSDGIGENLWLNADEITVRDRLTNPSINTLENLIGNYKIVVIDEIQRVVNAGLLLKLMVDNFKDVQFIATGSSALEISDSIFEPLTGRHILFRLYPFSLVELYHTRSPFEIEKELPFHLVYGSYPEVSLKKEMSQIILENLAQQYLYKDVLVWKDIRKPDLLDKLLKLLAYQIGSEVSVNELSKNLKVKSETIENYLDLLEKAFVIFRLKSYSNNARKEVSKMSKVFFWDNGIRNAVIDDYRDISMRNDQGQLFENFMIAERMKMNAWQNKSAKSYFWRNYNQSEVDYVEVNGDNISAYEMKWNTHKKLKVTKAFTNIYTTASTEVITPENFMRFASLK